MSLPLLARSAHSASLRKSFASSVAVSNALARLPATPRIRITTNSVFFIAGPWARAPEMSRAIPCPPVLSLPTKPRIILFVILKVLIHRAEEGGLWAEVPSLPGCVSQGETIDELRGNVREAIEA